MEKTELQQILGALEDFSNKINEQMQQMEARMDKKMEDMEARMDKRFDQMDKRFERLEAKTGGIRADLTETQETTDFLASKSAQHEQKLRQVNNQLNQTV